MKKILLGLLIVALVLGLTACSPESYKELAEKMGGMKDNVFGIEANMADVDKATEKVSASVSYKEDGSADIDYAKAAEITAAVSSIKDSDQKTAALKAELAKPIASSEEEQTAVQTALTEKKTEMVDKISDIDTSALSDGQKEVLQSIQDTISSIQISENPTMAELTTIAVLSEMADVAAGVAQAEDHSVYVTEEGELTEAGKEVAGTALESLETLKMVSEVAGMDLLKGMSLSSLMSTLGGDPESKGIGESELSVLRGFSKAVAQLTNCITNPEEKAFDQKKYDAFIAEARAVKATYELLAAAYARPTSYEDCDKILSMPINHGLKTADLTRYLVASVFVTLDNLKDENQTKVGVNALKDYITTEIYEALMDVGNKYADLEQAPEGIEIVWETFADTFKSVNDPYALKTVATLAVIMVDADFTDILSMKGGDGKVSTWINTLSGQEAN
ncbi:MAG: hypothetical protein J5800_06580 [Spirochaetales bacterium]|nr:hypothetical protein [Spirochaetales bacterium]